MTETALQFGPEWMRALCDRGPAQAASNSPTPAPVPSVKYKLAEFRYGREEMLALFEQNTRPPDELRRENPALVKEACQLPLSLIPMTEEETALWATSVNSEAVLRISNKERTAAGPGALRPPLNPPDRPLDPRDVRPGLRGDGRAPGLVSRGIGAAPGMRGGTSRPAPAASSTRGFGYSRTFDDDPEPERREGTRADVLKRSTSINEDQRTDRFRSDADESKPRIRLDSRSNAENWRSSGRSTNDGSNWRSSARREDGGNWKAGTSSSWRDDAPEDQGDHRNGRSRYRSNDWEHHHHNDDGSNLPEWSLDDGGTTVGTFDASGAFRSGSPGKELEDDGEGEWTSVPSNRTKRTHGQKDPPHADRPANRDDGKHLVRDQNEGFDNSYTTQSLQQHMKSQNARSERNERHDEFRREENTSYHRSEKNGTTESKTEHTSQSREHEEDFCSIEKLTESMVMKWTEEEEAKSSFAQQQQEQRSGSLHAVPSQSKAGPSRGEVTTRWFYQDPQGELQGPFMSSEMMEWYTAGYFQMNLLVRRSEDERFSELGAMINSCKGRVPFSPGVELPPVRLDKQPLLQKPPPTGQVPQSNNLSALPAASAPTSLPAEDLHVRQLLLYQIQQQAAVAAAAAAQQRLRQQQHLQHVAQQQQMQGQLRQLLEHLKRQEGFSELSQQEQQQVLLRQYTQLEQNRRSQQISAEAAAPQVPLSGRSVPGSGLMGSHYATPNPSMWELSNGGVMTSAALEEIQRREQEEQERKEDQKRKMLEEEQRRRHESEVANRKAEEEQQRRILEQQRKREEERQKEERAKQEEELRRQQEEERIAEEKRREEQRRRHEEMRKLEEMARKQKEEADRSRQKEEEEKIRQMQKQQQELDRQRHEHEARMRQQQAQQQAEALKRLQEKRGWGEVTPAGQLSLSEIQRLQEEKEFEERLEEMKQKASMRQTYYQNSSHKPGLTWVQSAATAATTSQVKTLAEIQREEAEKLAKVRKEQEEREKREKPVAAGIWSNAASQLSWKTSAGSAWGSQSPTSAKSSVASGIWESEPQLVSSNNHKQKESGAKQASGQTGKQSSAKTRKSEDSVIKLFESQRRSNDDFSKWCEEALRKFQSALDVETFVAFLRGLESPFDVNDYVRSYLGENKDSRDFAKQFLEKRSYYRNQERKKEQQEVMWGPAPAITPTTTRTPSGAAATNTVSSAPCANNHSDENSQPKGGKGGKKKKNKRLVDTSLLGFTVQADPDRIKSGEIESID